MNLLRYAVLCALRSLTFTQQVDNRVTIVIIIIIIIIIIAYSSEVKTRWQRKKRNKLIEAETKDRQKASARSGAGAGVGVGGGGGRGGGVRGRPKPIEDDEENEKDEDEEGSVAPLAPSVPLLGRQKSNDDDYSCPICLYHSSHHPTTTAAPPRPSHAPIASEVTGLLLIDHREFLLDPVTSSCGHTCCEVAAPLMIVDVLRPIGADRASTNVVIFGSIVLNGFINTASSDLATIVRCPAGCQTDIPRKMPRNYSRRSAPHAYPLIFCSSEPIKDEPPSMLG